MNCVIVDDDELSRSILEDLINDTDGYSLVVVVNLASRHLKYYRKNPWIYCSLILKCQRWMEWS